MFAQPRKYLAMALLLIFRDCLRYCLALQRWEYPRYSLPVAAGQNEDLKLLADLDLVDLMFSGLWYCPMMLAWTLVLLNTSGYRDFWRRDQWWKGPVQALPEKRALIDCPKCI